MPTLTIQLPGLPPVEHIVREDAITLGRMKGNSISLNELSVSLSHAKLTRIGNDFFLKDLNSTNGTMLNGQSVTEARLHDGDQLKFGEVVAYFRLEPLNPPATAPVSTPAPVFASMPAPVPVSVSPAPAPRPTAQSVPPPAAVVSAVPPASPSPAPAIRSTPPPSPAARRKSPRLTMSILGGVGGVAFLAAAGFLAWKFFGGDPAPAPHAPQVVSTSAPKKFPTNNIVAVKAAPATVIVAPSSDQNLDDLMKALKSPEVAVRRHAAAAIYNLGPAAQRALTILPGVLTDADPDVRMWTALALVHNNAYEKGTIPILVQTLHHENPTLRQVACLSLAMIPYTDAEKEKVIAALVATATKDTNADVANDATTALKIIAPDLVISK
jgi:predicted component of type VI protein secretion system